MSDELKEKKQSWLKKIFNKYKNKKQFDADTEKEADRIFVKLYSQHKDFFGNMPKIKDPGSARGKDYYNVLEQVRKVRKKNK